MRKVVKIVGIGERVSGISEKTKKSYDFIKVAFTYEDPYINGLMACNCTVPSDEIIKGNITMGDEVEVLLMYRNYQPYIAAFL